MSLSIPIPVTSLIFSIEESICCGLTTEQLLRRFSIGLPFWSKIPDSIKLPFVLLFLELPLLLLLLLLLLAIVMDGAGAMRRVEDTRRAGEGEAVLASNGFDSTVRSATSEALLLDLTDGNFPEICKGFNDGIGVIRMVGCDTDDGNGVPVNVDGTAAAVSGMVSTLAGDLDFADVVIDMGDVIAVVDIDCGAVIDVVIITIVVGCAVGVTDIDISGILIAWVSPIHILLMSPSKRVQAMLLLFVSALSLE